MPSSPLSLERLYDGDEFSDYLGKINQNFDEIVVEFAGLYEQFLTLNPPAVPPPPISPPGKQGDPGPEGLAGTRWFFGRSAPSSATLIYPDTLDPSAGDLWLDIETSALYVYQTPTGFPATWAPAGINFASSFFAVDSSKNYYLNDRGGSLIIGFDDLTPAIGFTVNPNLAKLRVNSNSANHLEFTLGGVATKAASLNLSAVDLGSGLEYTLNLIAPGSLNLNAAAGPLLLNASGNIELRTTTTGALLADLANLTFDAQGLARFTGATSGLQLSNGTQTLGRFGHSLLEVLGPSPVLRASNAGLTGSLTPTRLRVNQGATNDYDLQPGTFSMSSGLLTGRASAGDLTNHWGFGNGLESNQPSAWLRPASLELLSVPGEGARVYGPNTTPLATTTLSGVVRHQQALSAASGIIPVYQVVRTEGATAQLEVRENGVGGTNVVVSGSRVSIVDYGTHYQVILDVRFTPTTNCESVVVRGVSNLMSQAILATFGLSQSNATTGIIVQKAYSASGGGMPYTLNAPAIPSTPNVNYVAIVSASSLLEAGNTEMYGVLRYNGSNLSNTLIRTYSAFTSGGNVGAGVRNISTHTTMDAFPGDVFGVRLYRTGGGGVANHTQITVTCIPKVGDSVLDTNSTQRAALYRDTGGGTWVGNTYNLTNWANQLGQNLGVQVLAESQNQLRINSPRTPYQTSSFTASVPYRVTGTLLVHKQ